MIFWDNMKSAATHLTIEPVIILYYTALAMTGLGQQSLLLHKVCHPGDSLPPPSWKCDSEIEAQKEVTMILTWRSVLLHLVPVLFVLFAGPWSDSHGKCRKPLMYLPLIGQIVADLLCLLNVHYWSWPPAMVAMSGALPAAMTGWRACFNIGMHCYISDVSSVKSRTWRIGVCVGLVFLGIPVGSFIFGSVFHIIRHEGIFTGCIVLNSLAVLYLLVLVKDDKSSDQTFSSLFKGVFSLQSLKDSLKTIFSPRSGHKRCVIMLMIIAAPVTLNPLEGEYSVLYFFLRYKFNWDEEVYGLYAAYRTVIICFGTVVSMGILCRILRVSDAAIGMMASLTLMAASTGYSFADQPWQLFVCESVPVSDPIVDFLQGAGLAVVYSIVSKNVEPEEFGQVNSVIGVVDAVFPLFNTPLYTQVYKHTFTKLAGGFFLISFTYGTVGLVLFSVTFLLMRKMEVKATAEEQWLLDDVVKYEK